jgi:cytochrome b561
MIQWRNTDEHYGSIAQFLHWTVFGCIALQFVSALLVDVFPRASTEQATVVTVHESLGLAVLALVAIRIAWRSVNAAPPVEGPRWQRRLARAAHAGLYLLMAAAPIAGCVVASARGHDLSLFGLPLPRVTGPDRALARVAKEVHGVLAWTLLSLVAVHAAAAVWHHVVVRDGVLRRMLPRGKRVALGLRR